MKTVRLGEYKTTEAVPLSQEQLSALSPFRNQVEVLSSYKSGSYQLRTNSWVGELTLPGIHISILPKVGALNVLKMLLMGDGEATPLEVDSLNRIQSDNPFDLLAEILCSEIDIIRSSGFLRDYRSREANVTFVRGQVQPFKDMVANQPFRTGIYSRFFEYSLNTEWNQAIRWALDNLSKVVTEGMFARVTGTTRTIEEIKLVPFCPDFSPPERQHQYRRAMYCVSLVRRFLTTGMGSFGLAGQGMLVDMNKVFEGYIRETLRRDLGKHGFAVLDKSSAGRELAEGIKMYPDLVFARKGEVVFLGDCKYKVDWRPNQDAYQMLAYMEGYQEVKNVVVIHPTSSTESYTLSKLGMPRGRTIFGIGVNTHSLLEGREWIEALHRLLIGSEVLGAELVTNDV